MRPIGPKFEPLPSGWVKIPTPFGAIESGILTSASTAYLIAIQNWLWISLHRTNRILPITSSLRVAAPLSTSASSLAHVSIALPAAAHPQALNASKARSPAPLVGAGQLRRVDSESYLSTRARPRSPQLVSRTPLRGRRRRSSISAINVLKAASIIQVSSSLSNVIRTLYAALKICAGLKPRSLSLQLSSLHYSELQERPRPAVRSQITPALAVGRVSSLDNRIAPHTIQIVC